MISGHPGSVTNAGGRKIIKYEPPQWDEFGGIRQDGLLPKRKVSKSKRNRTPLRLMGTPESMAGGSMHPQYYNANEFTDLGGVGVNNNFQRKRKSTRPTQVRKQSAI